MLLFEEDCMDEVFSSFEDQSTCCRRRIKRVMSKLEDDSPKFPHKATVKSEFSMRHNMYKIFLLVIFQFASGIAIPVAQNGNGGGAFPGMVTWGYLRDYIDPEYANSPSNPNFYVPDDQSFLFLRNPNAISETDNVGGHPRFENNAIFDDSKDQLSQAFKSAEKKPLFTFDFNSLDTRRPNSKSVPENDVDRVVSDFIRVLPSRDRENFNSEIESNSLDQTQSQFPSNHNVDSRNQNFGDSNGGSWTVIKPNVIGITRRIPRIREETSQRTLLPTSTTRPDNGERTTKSARFGLLATSFPIPTTTTKVPLFTFIRERTLEESIPKSRDTHLNKASVFPSPTQLQDRRTRGRNSSNSIHSSITTLGSMITMVILSKLLLV